MVDFIDVRVAAHVTSDFSCETRRVHALMVAGLPEPSSHARRPNPDPQHRAPKRAQARVVTA